MPISTFHRRLAWIWTALLSLSCLLPSSSFEAFHLEQLFRLDKLLHFLCFGILALLWFVSLSFPKQALWLKMIAMIAAVASYGLLIEVLQASLHQGRHFEWGDIIADTMGGMIGVLLAGPYQALFARLKKYLPFIK